MEQHRISVRFAVLESSVMDFRPSILADGTLDTRKGQFSGLPLNSGLLSLREQDMRPSNPGLVNHAHRDVGFSRTHLQVRGLDVSRRPASPQLCIFLTV